MEKLILNKNRIQNSRGQNRYSRNKNFHQSKVVRVKKNKNFLLSLFMLGLVVTSYGAYSITKVKSFNQGGEQYIRNIDSNCKNYNKDTTISSIAVLKFSNDETLKSIAVLSFNKDKTQLFDFTNTTFNIDKGYTKGTFNDYLAKNHLYLDRSKILNNISGLFLREFNVKVDYIISGDENFSLEAFFSSFKSNVFSKFVSPTQKNITSQKVYSNICSEYINDIANIVNYTNIESRKVDFTSKKKLSDYFDLTEIKKEQVRVHINNTSGVEGWGGVMKKIFENYGINVVKVDDSAPSQFKTKVYFESKQLQGFQTSTQLTKLLQDPSVEFSVKENIYADIYIELGQDSLINY